MLVEIKIISELGRDSSFRPHRSDPRIKKVKIHTRQLIRVLQFDVKILNYFFYLINAKIFAFRAPEPPLILLLNP